MSAYQIKFAAEFNLLGVADERVDKNPFLRFRRLFEQVSAMSMEKPNAAVLATANKQAQPSARIVLIKELVSSGFVFYTNYQSRKGRDLAQNPLAELVFYWSALDSQIRIHGTVSKLSRESSEMYYHSRPRASQLGALVSPQSETISGREDLEKKIRRLDAQYAGQVIPLPENWGGYVLQPLHFEFWYNQSGRLHDRYLFEYQSGEWIERRLAP